MLGSEASSRLGSGSSRAKGSGLGVRLQGPGLRVSG